MGLSFPNSPATARVAKVYNGLKSTLPTRGAVRFYGHVAKSKLPARVQAFIPSPSFILVHYMYLIGFTLIGSIMIYPAGAMAYVDAVFFAAGASTQSGLNTINLNAIYTYQQVVLYFIGHLTNPITINTVVVFVRLYWFEKRFQHIVKSAQRIRRSKSRARSVSGNPDDSDPSRLEQGVNGRAITVLHHNPDSHGTTKPRAKNSQDPEKSAPLARMDDHRSKSQDEARFPQGGHVVGQNPALKRDITFADEIKPLDRREDSSQPSPAPDGAGVQHHNIAFLQRQRQKNLSTLRIPGPRDFDRGAGPKELGGDELNDEDDDDEQDQPSNGARAKRRQANNAGRATHVDVEGDKSKTEITFDESQRTKQAHSKDHPSHVSHSKSRFDFLRPLARLTGAPTVSRSVTNLRDRTRSFSFTRSQGNEVVEAMPYFNWQPAIGRNSAFVNLTAEQRDELGGIEYRSLKTLAVVLICYFVGFHLLGVVVFLPWIERTEKWGAVVDAVGQNRAWWSVFTSATLFNDLGFTLTPDSMISFQTAVVPMLLGSFLIVIGNTGFPCMLRFVIWCTSLMVPRDSALWEELHFLLTHPRRCFTLLFPARATWILFGILVLLNAIDLIFFVILDLHDAAVDELSSGFKVLDGLFQAVSTRTSGTACVNLADLHPAIQVSYLIMMYISVFPVAISVRRTNVYEENSLGVYAGDEDEVQAKSFVGQHLRRQLSFDLWYIFLGLFIITVVEGHRIQDNSFSIFAILFEIVSAYGTVGLSLGFPTNDMSLSAEFAVLSKLVIVAMMLRGRHRGLPYALDRAILLPSEKLNRKEQEAGDRVLARINSTSTAATRPDPLRSPLDERRGTDPMPPNSPTVRSATESAYEPSMRNRSRRGSDPGTVKKPTRLGSVIIGGLSAGPGIKHE